MERAEGLLGRKFLFKRQNYGTIDKNKVVCSICQEECSYHRSSSSLSYHLNAKHPTESSLRLDGRQPTLHDFSRKYHTKTPLCLAYIPCMTAREHEKNTIEQQCLKYTLSEVITRSFIRFSLEKKTNF